MTRRKGITRSSKPRSVRPLGVAAFVFAALAPLGARASLLFNRIAPTPGERNDALLRATFYSQWDQVTSEALDGSFLDFNYDTDTHQLSLVGIHMLGSDVRFLLPIELEATGIQVTFSAIGTNSFPSVPVDPGSGAFHDLVVPVQLRAQLGFGGATQPVIGNAQVRMAGTFTVDPATSAFQITDFTGAIDPPLPIYVTYPPYVLTGTLTFNMSGVGPVDDVPGTQAVGAPILVTGSGFTPASRLKLFVATSAGQVDVMPVGLAPTRVASDGTTWEGVLPWPWPAVLDSTLLGNGYASVRMIRPDAGYGESNARGLVLLGNPSLAEPVPSITAIAATPLSATSSDPSIATANVERVLAPGASVTLGGAGFVAPRVNVFAAAGNCAPPGGIVPSSSSATMIAVTIPADCPVGPGSIQVVNSVGSFRVSNAVAVALGEPISVTAVAVHGTTIEVTGTGFNALTVINLFAASGGTLVNAGGLTPQGAPRIPLTVTSAHGLTFERPAGLDPGAAYVQAINPPFIPFTSSGTAPGGGFALP